MSSLKAKASIMLVLLTTAIMSRPAHGLPNFDPPTPLPDTFNGIITMYPDSDNTKEKRAYWIVPSTARIVRKPDGKLAFGLVHSGVSRHDPDGINALLNVTVQPYIDEKTLQSAKEHVTKQAMAEGAQTVSFSFIHPTETTCRLLVGGQFVDWNGQERTVVAGGAVEAGIPFQHRTSNSFDVRCLTQAGGPDAAVFGALYTMKYKGLGNRVHVTVVCNFQETYKHFLQRVTASGFWGSAKINEKVEWQDLQKTGAVKLEVHEGTPEQVAKIVEDFHLNTIFKALFDQMTARTGAFEKTLKPSGLPDAPGGGGLFGWSVRAGGGFEQTTDTTDFRIEIDNRYTYEKEIAFGMNFASGGEELKTYVKNLTDSDKPFPTADDFLAQAGQHRKCRAANLAALKQMLDSGTITADQHTKYVDNAIQKGCNVDYTLDDSDALPADSNLTPGIILDFKDVRAE